MALTRYARPASGRGQGLRNGIHALIATRRMIAEARSKSVLDVHASMLGLYWDLGRLIRRAALLEERQLSQDRLDSLIATLARALCRLHGQSYSDDALRRMVRFAECYPTIKSRDSLRGLAWAHVLALLALSDPRQRDFFRARCLKRDWSPDRLRVEIRSMAYPSVPEGRSAAERSSPWALERPLESALDPDFAAFVGCAEGHPKGTRGALIRAMESHLLKLEAGFSLVERRKRFQVGSDDFYLDLLLYNRRLRCLFALSFDYGARPSRGPELMNFMLTWLNLHERQPGENPPVGIVFDADAPGDRLGIRHLESESFRIAWHQTGMPPRTQAHQFFLQSLAAARAAGEG
ncbi:MAG TPA: PDDEXK nuclease domain-containing protein [bacterium]|jgi:predicted nuclease of restriction endonuclease-like (RecB) superfamily|nr:PDDEXK nuclease domain-containing protein [bacterium]